MSRLVGAAPADPELPTLPERPCADAPAFPLSSGLAAPSRRSGWKRLEAALWTVAAGSALLVFLAVADRAVFSSRQGSLFDESLAAAGRSRASAEADPAGPSPGAARVSAALAPLLPFVGKLELPTLALTALVVDGVDAKTLSRAVGRIPSSSRPGEAGDVALAGHRDADFRSLGKLERGDPVILRTAYGEFHYEVESIRIVAPLRIDVLAPAAYPTLTLVTCYPFHYVGPAPLRYVVRAREVARPSRATI